MCAILPFVRLRIAVEPARARRLQGTKTCPADSPHFWQ